VANCIPGPNLCRLLVGLRVEREGFGWPLRGIVWFTVAIAASCTVIALLAGYVQKTKSLEKVTHRVEAVTVD
jgi:chromate transport protein ChrA